MAAILTPTLRAPLHRSVIAACAALILVLTGLLTGGLPAFAQDTLTPKGPTFNDTTRSVQIPSDRGIRYHITIDGEEIVKDGLDFAKPGTYTKDDGIRTGVPITVTAKPVRASDTLDGQTEWTHTLPDPTQVTPKGPTFDDAAQSVYIPADRGVRYHIDVDGTAVVKDDLDYAKPGTYTKDDGIRAGVPITVTAVSAGPDVELTGATAWSHTFDAPNEITPKGPTFDDAAQSVRIPSDQGVRYYIRVEGKLLEKEADQGFSKPGTYTKDDGIRAGVPIEVEAKPAGSKDVLTGTTAWSHTFPAPNEITPKGPTFDDAAQSVYIPSDQGVRYYITVDGKVLTKQDDQDFSKPGTYTKDDGIRAGVEITVEAKPVGSKDVLTGTTSWSHTFAAPNEITPKGPTFNDANATVYIPSDQGVRYYIRVEGKVLTKQDDQDFSKPGTYTKDDGIRAGVPIEVEAKAVGSKDVLTGTTTWSHTFPAPNEITPKGPTFNDANRTVYIPADRGVRYYITVDGKVLTKQDDQDFSKPGTYTKDDGIRTGVEIKVEAKPVGPKDVLTGTTSWSHTFPAPNQITPKGPTFDDWAGTVYIPSDRGVRYYITIAGKPIVKDGLTFSKPGLYTKDDGIRTGVEITVEAKAAGSADELTGTVKWTHTLETRPERSLAGGDEFNDASHLPNAGWKAYDTTGKKHAKATKTIYTKDALKVTDGNLEIRTARHCLKDDQKPSADTESPGGAVCPAGTRTMYTSGRIETDHIYQAPFEMEIRARMSDGMIDGMHFAGWLLNDQPYCTSPSVQRSELGEIDTMEVYTQHRYTTNTTHVTCTNTGGKGAGTKRDAHRLDGDIAGTWNTYRMTWDGYAVRYYFNGKLVPSSRPRDTPETTGKTVGLSQDEFRAALLNHPYQAIIDSLVFPSDLSWGRTVRDDKPFPARVDRVDYFRLKQLDDVYPIGAIRTYWQANEWLGAPRSPEEDAGPAGVRKQVFEKGTVYWSGRTGAHSVTGAVQSTYDAAGGAGGWLGLPKTDELRLSKDGGVWQDFDGGKIHWSRTSGAHPTKGAIQDYWRSQRWENGWLGYPTSAEQKNRDGSVRQSFQGGTVYWSGRTGAHGVKGAVKSAYDREKGADGWLGLPKTDELRLRKDGGVWQDFDGGKIHWSRRSGAHATKGAIQGYWRSQGWENGWLGYPTSGEKKNRDGSVRQTFQGGELTWRAGRGVSAKRY